MALLILFGFVAGIGTALSPCVLPVLPIALSAGATGGRRRPVGIVVGLAVSFTFATVALVYLLDAIGLPDDLLRTLAIVVLAAFGAVLLVPPLAARVEGGLSRAGSRLGGPRSAGDGFGSGLLVGASLGLVYAPCAGPVLAGVITVSAAQPFAAGRLAVALAYGVGSAFALYALMLGGRRLVAPLRRRGNVLQPAMGAVHGARGARHARRLRPALPERDRQGPALVPGQPDREPRANRRGAAGAGGPARRRTRRRPDDAGSGARVRRQPAMGSTRPGTGRCRCTRCAGRVVLVDFWTYSCINCLRTLPHLEALDRRYRAAGLTIVGVHTPEFPFEKDAGNVRAAIAREGIRYPGRPGQRPRDVERLRQPELAGGVLHRRSGTGALQARRRGRVRLEGARHPAVAGRGGTVRGGRAAPSRSASARRCR